MYMDVFVGFKSSVYRRKLGIARRKEKKKPRDVPESSLCSMGEEKSKI